MSRAALVVAAKRSAVVPRGGAFAGLEVDALAAPVITACLDAAGLQADRVDDLLLGNALYGGGNPARRVGLFAGLPQRVPGITLDRQCTSGLDAVLLAARLVESGAADCVVAGGVESFSRAPIRMRRPVAPDELPAAYARPPFTPWPERDPEMAEAAADLAALQGISTERQIGWTCRSHAAALTAVKAGRLGSELVGVEDVAADTYARALTPGICRRSKRLAGDEATGVRAATAAVEADAAAVCLIVSRDLARNVSGPVLQVLDGLSIGSDPTLPGLAPVGATQALLARRAIGAEQIAVAEVMEAYAAQAIACVDGIGLDPSVVNRGGGALARGHPIGASGAILAVRLYHELKTERPGSLGLATIAAAGGLATSLLVARA